MVADNERTGNSDSEESTSGDLTVVTIPVNRVQEVLDFVAGLDQEESDVSGHMISGGALAGIGGNSLLARGRSLSGCTQTGGTFDGTDWQCSDTDKN